MPRTLLRLLPCLAIALLAGCSSFNRRFSEAAKAPVKPGEFAGAYSGRWTSSRNSVAGGNLRCILSRLENVPCGHAPSGSIDYLADFHATWHGFASEHTVVLHTKPAGRKMPRSGARAFQGESTLHTIIGAGRYMCEGEMDRASMRACYDATYDKGVFELSRVHVQSQR